MRYASIALVLVLSAIAVAEHSSNSQRKSATLMPGLGNHHHPVSTKHAEAQKFFDQGLKLIYAFNHDEAIRSFARAAELDPELAMAYWGMALAKGPNYNLDADAEQHKAAYEALQKALKLADRASEPERAYIQALAKRYSADPKADKKKLAAEYKNAMGELARRYPDDLDAATLYAESAMNLRPWELWNADGMPAEGTEEIIAVLESVLRRNPGHPGANHYYIHTVEASPSPERALPSAHRLATLVPAAGHLVHMPAHIYMRVGDYAAAAKANEQAIAADEAYLKGSGATGVYPMMYYSHNIHFLAVAEAMQGRLTAAKKTADKLTAHVAPHVHDMPMLEGFLPVPTLVLVRFGQWDDILASPAPSKNLKITKAMWHYARGLACLAKGKLEDAAQERQAFQALRKEIPADAPYSDRNKAQEVLAVADAVLDAKLLLARKDRPAGLARLRQAVELEDTLKYMEPSDWIIPVRESLGSALLASGDAAEAEKVFRADLERNRRNGRSLFGLRESLKTQKKTYAAQMIDQEFRAAWRNAEVRELKIDDL